VDYAGPALTPPVPTTMHVPYKAIRGTKHGQMPGSEQVARPG